MINNDFIVLYCLEFLVSAIYMSHKSSICFAYDGHENLVVIESNFNLSCIVKYGFYIILIQSVESSPKSCFRFTTRSYTHVIMKSRCNITIDLHLP